MVESALTMPLMVFLLLGTLQMFMMFHARVLTQLAVFQANRAGSLNHGNCERMVHAAILQVLPSIEAFAKPSGSLSTNVADAFARVSSNSYGGRSVALGAGLSTNFTGTVLWLVRRFEGRAPAYVNGQDGNFDQSVAPQRLETQIIYWFPMRVPFANWVIGRAVLAHFGIQAYTAQNALMIRQTANWQATSGNALAAEVRAEMFTRMNRGEFVFPIMASSTMRMMTPLKQTNTVLRNCPPTPQSL